MDSGMETGSIPSAGTHLTGHSVFIQIGDIIFAPPAQEAGQSSTLPPAYPRLRAPVVSRPQTPRTVPGSIAHPTIISPIPHRRGLTSRSSVQSSAKQVVLGPTPVMHSSQQRGHRRGGSFLNANRRTSLQDTGTPCSSLDGTEGVHYATRRAGVPSVPTSSDQLYFTPSPVPPMAPTSLPPDTLSNPFTPSTPNIQLSRSADSQSASVSQDRFLGAASLMAPQPVYGQGRYNPNIVSPVDNRSNCYGTADSDQDDQEIAFSMPDWSQTGLHQ
ncbi:hypothetical protein BDW22DRAFT_1343321 [Trametopsis cervina]|nr:hypothetical protein BDW22DRAFT_1343321 [Trametopsis cervina]